MRQVLLVLMLVLAALPLHSRELSEAGTRELCDKAMSYFDRNKLEQGYRLFLPYWPLPESEITALIFQTKSQWGTVKARFGQNAGYEFIKTKRVGDSLIRHIYIQKFMNHSIRWQFTFYRPKQKWRVNGLTFDDEVGQLFHE